MKHVSIAPDDLLDAARTIRRGDISTCDWLTDWLTAETFLQWARRGLQDGNGYGLSNAVGYAKRAAACRIDLLIEYNHLRPFVRAKYPLKVDALRRVGISVSDVVQDLVINPRNTLEHAYRAPTVDAARHAVGVAELFVSATQEISDQSSIVAVGWNVLGSHLLSSAGEHVQFHGFSERPMLFIDVFDSVPAARIVDPKGGEVRSVELSQFDDTQTVALSLILRENYSERAITRRGAGASYFRAMKQQGGF